MDPGTGGADQPLELSHPRRTASGSPCRCSARSTRRCCCCSRGRPTPTTGGTGCGSRSRRVPHGDLRLPRPRRHGRGGGRALVGLVDLAVRLRRGRRARRRAPRRGPRRRSLRAPRWAAGWRSGWRPSTRTGSTRMVLACTPPAASTPRTDHRSPRGPGPARRRGPPGHAARPDVHPGVRRRARPRVHGCSAPPDERAGAARPPAGQRAPRRAGTCCPAVAAPTLVLHGSDDLMSPVGNAELLAGRIPGAELARHTTACGTASSTSCGARSATACAPSSSPRPTTPPTARPTARPRSPGDRAVRLLRRRPGPGVTGPPPTPAARGPRPSSTSAPWADSSCTRSRSTWPRPRARTAR